MKKYMLFSLSLMTIAALLLGACGPTTTKEQATQGVVVPTQVATQPVPSVPDPNRQLNLYVVQHALCSWDSWWCTMKTAVDQAQKDFNVKVTVLGPDSYDLQKTAALIDQAVAAKPDGLAVTVTDPVLFKEPIMRAIEAGIPVVAFNAGSGPEKDGIPYMTYIGMDEFQGGYQAGQQLVAAGATKGVCINHQVGHAGLEARCQGMLDAFAAKGGSAEVLPVTNDPAESQTIISNYFTANADVNAALTLGPNSANPFYAYLEAAGKKPGDILHGTFDLNDEIIAKIKDDTTLFGIDQQPYLQGYASVMWLAFRARYGLNPASPITPTGPGFIYKADVDKQPQPDKPVKIYMVQHALCSWDSWWCTMKNAVDLAQKGMNVEVTVLGPDSYDLQKTAALIDQAIAAKPDGLAVTVTDPVLFKEPIMRAIEAGIPVVAFNAGSGPEKDGIPYMTYIGMDEFQGGYYSGMKLLAAGASKGVCINHQVGHAGLEARCQGMLDAFAEKGGSAEVLPVTNDPAESQTIISNYFTANADVNAALTLGPNSANPFYAYLEAAGKKPGDVLHGTFDLSTEIAAKIKDGTTLFAVDQQPFLQGYLSIMMLTLYNRQNLKPAGPITPTGPGFVDLTNVDLVQALAGQYR